MAYEVIFTRAAAFDLDAITEYVAQDSRLYAEALANRILAAVESLADFPLRGRVVPEFKNAAIREIFVAQYRIIYRVKDDAVEIWAVFHGKRLVP